MCESAELLEKVKPCCHGNQLHYILVYFYYVGYVTNKGLPIQLEVFLAA
jgi:hypothetical protein